MAPHLSEAEWTIMKIVWRKRACSAQEIITDVSSEKAWSPSTTKTLLNRLLRKGALHFKKTGKSYLYLAIWSEEQCRTREATGFLNRVFNGSLSPMLAHFVQSRRLTKKELKELQRILKGEA